MEERIVNCKLYTSGRCCYDKIWVLGSQQGGAEALSVILVCVTSGEILLIAAKHRFWHILCFSCGIHRAVTSAMNPSFPEEMEEKDTTDKKGWGSG
jgi:hypothetical protein